MKLIALSEARDRAGLQDLSSSNVILDGALETATTQVEALLRTPLGRKVRSDLFYANSDMMPFAIPSAKLLLGSGFVDDGEGFEVYSGITSADALGGGELIDSDRYLIDDERGVLLFTDYDPDKLFLRVEYTAGFTATSDVFDGTPSWLVDLGFTVGLRTYASIRHDDGLKKQFDYMTMLEPKIRYEPAAIRPLI